MHACIWGEEVSERQEEVEAQLGSRSMTPATPTHVKDGLKDVSVEHVAAETVDLPSR